MKVRFDVVKRSNIKVEQQGKFPLRSADHGEYWNGNKWVPYSASDRLFIDADGTIRKERADAKTV